MQDKEGTPYIQASGSDNFTFGTVDFTNPAASNWYQMVIRDNMIDRHISGWMSDFGEYLPFDAVLHHGSASVVHNQFPALWAEVNHRAVAHSAGSSSSEVQQNLVVVQHVVVHRSRQHTANSMFVPLQVVYFSRAGSLRSPGSSPLFWLGDQLVTWDRFDGLQSVSRRTVSSPPCV